MSHRVSFRRTQRTRGALAELSQVLPSERCVTWSPSHQEEGASTSNGIYKEESTPLLSGVCEAKYAGG